MHRTDPTAIGRCGGAPRLEKALHGVAVSTTLRAHLLIDKPCQQSTIRLKITCLPLSAPANGKGSSRIVYFPTDCIVSLLYELVDGALGASCAAEDRTPRLGAAGPDACAATHRRVAHKFLAFESRSFPSRFL